jgi:hypothetical protein
MFFMPSLLRSYSVWIRTSEPTSLSFEEPRSLPTCECSSFTPFLVANHARVNISDWQGVISTDLAGKFRFPNSVQCAVLNGLSSIIPIR